jgi:hypothetical protein
MKQKLIKSTLPITLIPLIALAIEPSNPEGFCERFIREADIKKCEERTKNDDVDWYAATICNLQKDDKAFWKCWEGIKNQTFNPGKLDACGEQKDLSDLERQACLNTALNRRSPASQESTKANDAFQDLKIRK